MTIRPAQGMVSPVQPARALLSAVLAALTAACGGGDAQRSLLVVTIDTLRADKLSCYGYFRETSPVLDQLADEGVLFERAFAPLASTLPSHASLFTGLWPTEHEIHSNMLPSGEYYGWKDGVSRLAELAREEGFATAGFISAVVLTAQSGMSAGFDTYDAPERGERAGAETTDLALRWLEENGEAPFFLWVHLFDPHYPHKAEGAFDRFPRDAALDAWLAARRIPLELPGLVEGRAYKTLPTHRNYDGEVLYADAMVGRLLDDLRGRGRYDETVVVVVADHGEGLNQHGMNRHGSIWGEQLHVPFLLRVPGGRGDLPARVSALVGTVDVLPTALPFVSRALAERFAAQASGQDVFDPAFAQRPVLGARVGENLPADPKASFSLRAENWKLVHRLHGPDELYDLETDPHELTDVAADHPEVVEALRRELSAQLARQASRAASLGASGAPVPLDAAHVEDLGHMGYAEDMEER